MIKRNPNLVRLKSNYLFPEIQQRKKQFLANNPNAELISLGIGDTTEPIPLSITKALEKASISLGTLKGYSGYGSEQGMESLRKKIAAEIYHHSIRPEEVFVSDGAKCDIGRLQTLFGNSVSIAIQNPAYPVYLDGSIIQGVSEIVSMPCTPQNHFFPDLHQLPRTDLIYFCSPNNPTGATATKTQLEELIGFAKRNRSIILYDSAYASYIQDPSLPKSIYEIDGAQDVAIETNSFSKMAGFTGIRLGWTVVPEALKYQDGTSIRTDWNRLTSTIFNGASNIAQQGGIASLNDQGKQEILALCQFYLENADIIKKVFNQLGYLVYGGVNAPYLWVYFKGKNSWDAFQDLMEKTHIVSTPGSGFGSEGEGFLRFSAFGHREDILEAASRLKTYKTKEQ